MGCHVIKTFYMKSSKRPSIYVICNIPNVKGKKEGTKANVRTKR